MSAPPSLALEPALPRLTRAHLVTLALAAAGTLVFSLAGLPLPFLFGPMAATLIGALAGLRLASLKLFSDVARMIIGITVGASVSPALLQILPDIAGSIALIPIYVLAIGLIGVPFFRRVHGLDPVTAFYAAMPGGLQDMVSFGQEAGANVRAVSLIHATRVLILVAAAPLVLSLIYDVSLSGPRPAGQSGVQAGELLLMAAAGVMGTAIGRRIGLFGAPILGPLILTAALSLAGLIHGRPPQPVMFSAQFLIGMSIGVYYMGLTLRELHSYVLSGIAYGVVLGLFTAIFSEIVALLGFAPPIEAFLAFAPGGQAEMTFLAIAIGADITYVLPHHLVRVILVITGAPLAARLMNLRRP